MGRGVNHYPIPRGLATIPFRIYQEATRDYNEVPVKCEVEVMMVAFSTNNCRIRGTILQDVKGAWSVGDTFGAKDMPLTLEIISIMNNFLEERINEQD